MTSLLDPDRDTAATRLTRAQELLWVTQELHPETPLYNQGFLFFVDGELDMELLQHGLEILVHESETLRTVIQSHAGIPTQRELDAISFSAPLLDLEDEPDPHESFIRWASDRRDHAPDVSERTFDAGFAQLGGETGIYFSHHHFVADAWSTSLHFKRLSDIYSSLEAGSQPDLAPIPSYREYVDFEHSRRTGTEPVADAQPLGSRTSLYGTSAVAPDTGSERLVVPLGAERWQRLRKATEDPEFRALTPDLAIFRLLLTAYLAFIRIISQEERLTVGTLSHNRGSRKFRQTPGLFSELFPIVIETEELETFRSLYSKALEASDRFLRRAGPGGSSAEASKTISNVLNYMTTEFGEFARREVTTRWMGAGHVEPEHLLRLHVTRFRVESEPELLFDLNTSVFDSAHRKRVPHHFLAVLERMLDDFDQEIDDTAIVGPADVAVMNDLNAGFGEADCHVRVIDLFEANAVSMPGELAISDGRTDLTYDQLAELVRKASRQLPRGQNVVINLPRSIAAVVVMLAALRAGSTFVLVDPSWPKGRINAVVDDSDASLVIGAAAGPRARTLDYDELLSATGQIEVPADSDATEIAYVLYTSGSTGAPKGVMVSQSSLSNYVTWACHFYDGGRRLRFPLFTPLTFDLTITSVFVPLVSGGSIQVYPDQGGRADLAVQDVFSEGLVDIVKLTPSHLSLLRDLNLSKSRIGQLILGGEALPTSAMRDLINRMPDLVAHNEYGPTEATVGCVVHTFDRDRDRDLTVPIGKPIAGMRAHVVSRKGVALPIGVPGELVLAGAGIAEGYLHREDETRESFRSFPGLGEPKGYSTGDVARVRFDGLIEYQGRQDDQIKLNGVRIELGEVDAAIASHPLVTGAAARPLHRTSGVAQGPTTHCGRCGLPSDYPGIDFDTEGVCSLCTSYDTFAERASVYFEPIDKLKEVFDRHSHLKSSEYDCISLLSGGKDSTYALARLVDMGYNPLAFTLDNGYISREAISNIRRVCDALGVDHIFGSTPEMNQIFVDSLQRHSNVCNGCFKTIYTLSMQLAKEKGIPIIVTGLSRGQFFETRLTEDLFSQGAVTSEEIDERVLTARKAYHRVEDAPRRLLDVRIFENEGIFDDVQFIDFYRFSDVTLDDMLDYLDRRLPWVRPGDTGRSTNCLINDVGIYVHRIERGFHNYALPYSWDVRMGVKTREEAIEELDDQIDVEHVERILEEIGYPGDISKLGAEAVLVGYYTGEGVSPAEVRRHVEGILPASMVPSRFVAIDEIPLTRHGKVDRGALPDLGKQRPDLRTTFVPPRDEKESQLAKVWCDVLDLEQVGVRDNFFDVGGDSIRAIQIVARSRQVGLEFSLRQMFDSLTIERLADIATPFHDRTEEGTARREALTPSPIEIDKLAQILKSREGR